MGTWTQVGNIKGPAGDDGKSAYELWLEVGNTGTVEDFLASLHGTDGEDGEDGQDGVGGGGSGAVIDPFELLDIPTITVPVTTEVQPGGVLADIWAVGGTFTCTHPGPVLFEAGTTGAAYYLMRGAQETGNIDPATFGDLIVGAWNSAATATLNLQAGQAYTWFSISQDPTIESVDISQISYVASHGGLDAAALPPDQAVVLRVTDRGTLRAEKAPASTREDSGARMYGPYDLAPVSLGPGIQEGFGPQTGTLMDEENFSHALSLHAVSGIMEARVALTVDLAALTSGVGGATGPFEQRVVMYALDTGFDYGIRSVFPLTIAEPAPGFSAQIEFTARQGAGYPPYVSILINKQDDASWDDLGTAFTAIGTFVAPFYKLEELKGQRGYAPEFSGGAPSAPKPSATRLFAAKQIPAVKAQPPSGQYINIGPVVDYDCLPTGFGDINDNTGPCKIVGWQLGRKAPVDFGFTFETEEIRTWRRLNDGWVWVPSSDPRGGTDGSTDYLATNAPVPGPGPVLTPWRAVTGTDPAGLGHMVHVLDVAQHSNGNLYICGARDFTAQEAIDADAVAGGPFGFVGADNSMACVWRSDDGGVTWTEVVKTFYPYGPNGYQRLYAIGQVGDRLFVQSFEPCLADGTPDPDGRHKGYWQMEPDESWTLMPPLDVDPGVTVGLGYSQERALPRAANRSSWGGTYVNDDGFHAVVYTYTDHLVLTEIPGNSPIAVDEKSDGTPVGNGYITLGLLDSGSTGLKYGDGTPIPVDRTASSEPYDRWSFQVWGNKLLVCNRMAVFSIDRTYPEEPAPPTEES